MNQAKICGWYAMCGLCESPVARRFKLGSQEICAWCLKAIACALVEREETREKELRK